MGLREYLAAGFIGIAAGISAPYFLGSRDDEEQACTGVQVADICFDIEHSKVISSYSANHGRVFVLLYEHHLKPNVQEEVFFTLEELINENKASFLAVEYFEGEFSYKNIPSTKRLSGNITDLFNDIISRPIEKRKRAVFEGIGNGNPFPVSLLFELVYQGSLLTFGMDDWGLREKADNIWPETGRCSDMEKANALIHDISINQRSVAFVSNITEYLASHPETGNIVIVSTGSLHRNSLEHELAEKGISYIGLIPASYADYYTEQEYAEYSHFIICHE